MMISRITSVKMPNHYQFHAILCRFLRELRHGIPSQKEETGCILQTASDEPCGVTLQYVNANELYMTCLHPNNMHGESADCT